MDSQHKAIRAVLTTMAPRRATDYVKAFELPEDEERYILECDVRGKSQTQVAIEWSVSPDLVKKKRRRAYAKMADELNNR